MKQIKLQEMEPIKQDNRICRALIAPTESQEYDFEAVAVPFENGQIRYSYQNDEYFNQVLLVNRENIDTARLESGIPLFDNHPWEQSAMNTLGITVSYDFDDRGLIIRGKFGSRADDALKNDVKNGIIKTVSIEGQIINYEVSREMGKVPEYRATFWQPESLSFAPVPQDIASQIEVKRAIQKQITESKEAKPDNGSFINKLINKF